MNITQTGQGLYTNHISKGMQGVILLSGSALAGLLKQETQALLARISDSSFLDMAHSGDRRTIQPGRCYDFDGNNDYIEFDFIPNMNYDKAFTVSFRVKPTNTTGTQRIIQNIESSVSRFGVSLSSDVLSVGYYDGSTYSQVASCSFASTGASFVCITHDTDGTMTIKINDVSQTLGTVNPSLTGGSGFRFGDSTGASLLGKLRAVKIYEGIATDEEQTKLYNHNSLSNTVLLDCECDEGVGVRSYSKNGIKGEMKNVTLTSFHTTDVDISYSEQNKVGYIDNAGLLLYSGATKAHPNQSQAYKSNPGYLRTTTANPSNVFTATTRFVISCRVKIDSEGANSANANHCVNMPYGYLQIRGTGQQYVIRVDTSASAYVSFDYEVTGDREWKHVLGYIDPTTTTTKLYMNGQLIDLDTRTITGTLTFRQDDIYLGYGGGSNADVTLADVRLYEVTGTPTDAEALSVYNGIDPVGRTKHHHLTLNGDIDDTGTSAEVWSEEASTSVFVDTYKEYTGSAPLDFTMVGSHCANFDGVDDYISIPSLTGSETIVSYEGTATPSVAVGRINATAGTLYNIVLSNGSHYPISIGTGTVIYDVVNGNNGTATNITQSSFRGATQDTYHYNIKNNIPNPSGNRHNGCETKIKAPPAPSLIHADTDDIWFDSSGVPQEIGYSDLVTREKNHAISNSCQVTPDGWLKLFSTKSYNIGDVYPFTETTSFTVACKFKFTAFPSSEVSGVFGSSFHVGVRVSSSGYLQYTIRGATFTQMNWGTLSLNTEYDYYITYDHTTQKYYFYMDGVLDNPGGTTAPATFSCDDWQISRYAVRGGNSANADYEVQRARIYDTYMTATEITEDRGYVRRMDAGENLVGQRTGLDYQGDADDVIQADCVVPSNISFADISTRNQKKNIVIYETPRTSSTTPTLEKVQSLLHHI